MRLAVFSDVHGNPYALEAVMNAIKAEGAFDAIVAAGDLCLGGSDPGTCIDLLLGMNVQAVYGNTEEYLREPDVFPPDDRHRSQWDIIQPAVYWTNARLSAQQKKWLDNLPFSLRFSPNGKKADDLVVVHANPKNCELMLLPSEEDQYKLWGEVRQPDDSPELSEVFSDTLERTIVFGHHHIVSRRRWKDIDLICVAPVALPSIDHDLRTRFSILTWEKDRWEVRRIWISYDTQIEINALAVSGMPVWEEFAGKYRMEE